jgi:SAM-dependent methyltransferase
MNENYLMTPDEFSRFSYSKRQHFRFFYEQGFDVELLGTTPDPDKCDLKVYQDLLVFSFIRLQLPKNSRILEIGGGQSRILTYFSDSFECWNLDKLEGIGTGPTLIDIPGSHLVRDYIGNFSKALPDYYFDFVFSISALEHVPHDDPRLFDDIYRDINRTLKSGRYSLHLLDGILFSGRWFHWRHPILRYLFEHGNMLNTFLSDEEIITDGDLFVMSEAAYNSIWFKFTQETYEDFGKPFSYAVLWRT